MIQPRVTGPSDNVCGRGAAVAACEPYARGPIRRGALGLLRWALVTVFLSTGVWKLIEIEGFRAALLAMGLFPNLVIPMLTWLTPGAELVVALSLGLRRAQALTLPIAMFLACAFAGMHLYVYQAGIVVPCGCAGIRETIASSGHLWMAAGCIAMFLAAAVLWLSDAPGTREFVPAPDRSARSSHA